MNEAIKVIKSRRSCREFTPKPIKEEYLRELVDCARLAPSGRNEQPCEFIVVTDRNLLNKIADITDYGKFIKDCPACIVVIAKPTKYYLEDGSAATENILLAAESLQIQSCWVAGDKKFYAKDILNLLKVPNHYKLVSIIALGYGKFSRPRAPKRPLEELLHKNFFGNK